MFQVLAERRSVGFAGDGVSDDRLVLVFGTDAEPLVLDLGVTVVGV